MCGRDGETAGEGLDAMPSLPGRAYLARQRIIDH